MSTNRTFVVDFGPGKTGLSSVGYSLAGAARSTLGVSEVEGGTGIYASSIVVPSGTQGTLLWDTGDASIAYAAEEINPGGDAEYLDAAVSSRLPASDYVEPPNAVAIQADLQAALTAQGYTAVRAGYLDALNGLVAAVWSYGARTLTGFGTLAGDAAAAVWGATARTLSAFGFGVDLNRTATALDGVQPSASFFANDPTLGATQVTVTVPAVLPGYTVTEGDLPAIRRGDSWSAGLTGLGTLTGRTRLWATAKRDPRRSDGQADFALTETDGLLFLAGVAPLMGQTGTLTVTDPIGGATTLALSAAATAALGRGTLQYDVQILVGGTVRTLASGCVEVVADVTRAVA